MMVWFYTQFDGVTAPEIQRI